MGNNLEQLKYPIGKFQLPIRIHDQHLNDWIATIRSFPTKIRQEVELLNENELAKTYRPEGWTIKQLVHHCADSHINSFTRFKLALTEQTPTIKPYLEHLWAELPDAKSFPIGSSIQILEGLHARWAHLLDNLSESEWEKKIIHPETNREINLKVNLGIYAWHSEHHLAHIRNAKNS